MFLSDFDITRALQLGDIRVIPEVAEEDIQSVGIRVHLGNLLLIPCPGQTIDPRRLGDEHRIRYWIHDLEKDGDFWVKPGSNLMLGCTSERIQTNKSILMFLDTRSSHARIGLSCHMDSHVINGTWNEPIRTVLELTNQGPFEICLYAGMPIAMAYFAYLDSAVTPPRRGTTYPGQDGPQFPGRPLACARPSPLSRLQRFRHALAQLIIP